MKNLIDTITVPRDVVLNSENYGISDEQLIILFKLIATAQIEVDFMHFLKSTGTSKTIISQMVSQKLIDIKEVNSKIIIDLMPFYQLVSGQVKEQTKPQATPTVGLSAVEVDKLCHIFGKKLFPQEIEQINGWVKQGHSFDKIETAIYSALSRGVNNLNYIEKIVINNKEQQNESPSTHTIKRNWNF